MYKGDARWDPIHEVASHPDIEIPIFGNGDVTTPERAHEMQLKYPNISGIMIGRGSIGNPWIFQQIKHYLATGNHLPQPSIAEKAKVARRHLLMSVEWKGLKVAIGEMRRHYSNYFKGIPNFKPIRMKLVTSNDLQEILDTLSMLEENYPEPFPINL
jgi:tRNA-dihydrouridine synthase B